MRWSSVQSREGAPKLTALVAQWIEQEPSNLLVAGSIPAQGAQLSKALCESHLSLARTLVSKRGCPEVAASHLTHKKLSQED
jgi:hypothetical protein